MLGVVSCFSSKVEWSTGVLSGPPVSEAVTLVLLFTAFIAKKSASRRYDTVKEKSTSTAFFVMMGIPFGGITRMTSTDRCFSFSPLSFLFFVSSSSSTIVNPADSHAFNTNGSLTLSKEDASSDGKCFSMFLPSSDKLCIKLTWFCPVYNFL